MQMDVDSAIERRMRRKREGGQPWGERKKTLDTARLKEQTRMHDVWMGAKEIVSEEIILTQRHLSRERSDVIYDEKEKEKQKAKEEDTRRTRLEIWQQKECNSCNLRAFQVAKGDEESQEASGVDIPVAEAGHLSDFWNNDASFDSDL